MTRSPAARAALPAAGLLAIAASALARVDRPQCVVPPPSIPGLAARSARAIGAGGGEAETRAAPTGSLRLLVILAEFSDLPHRIAASRYGPHLFGGGLTLSTYYDEASEGRLDVTGDVYGWFTLPQSELYYSGGSQGVGAYPNNGQKLAEDAVAAAIAGGLNLANYDADGDDVVDALLVIHSGEGYEWAGTAGPGALTPVPDPNAINSHKWVVVDGDFGPGLPRVADYFTGPELQRARTILFPAWTDSIATIGVFCHEMGHVLGLPDIYDVQTAESRLGDWEIMDAGVWTYVRTDPPVSLPGALPSHFSAWARTFLGWTAPIVVAPPVGELEQRSLTLTSASAGGAALQLRQNPGGVDWTQAAPGTGEYFLAEVRTQQGFDAGLPGEGLLVYHVDEGRRDNVAARYADGAGLLLLAPQDDRLSPNDDEDDPWPGAQSEFGPASAPSSALHDGSPSGVTLSAITAPSAGEVSLTADVVNLDTGVALPFARPNPWSPSAGGDVSLVVDVAAAAAPGVTVSVFDLLGRRVRTLDAVSEFASPGRIARWDGRADDGTKLPAGVYFFRVRGGPSGVGRVVMLR
jgi:immune inhibitor A